MKITLNLPGPCEARVRSFWLETVEHSWTVEAELTAEDEQWNVSDMNYECQTCDRRDSLDETHPRFVDFGDALADRAETIERLWADLRRLKASNQTAEAERVREVIRTLEAA